MQTVVLGYKIFFGRKYLASRVTDGASLLL